MTTYTVIATGQTTASASEVEGVVRDALASVGVELIPCGWAPDVDTIAEQSGVMSVELVDLN